MTPPAATPWLTRAWIRLRPVALLLALAGVAWLIADRAVTPELAARNATLDAELARVRATNDRLEREIEALRADLDQLRNRPEEQLHQARTQLGMVRPGEVVYQLNGRQRTP